ncbi:MAG: hypothetical protein BWY61_00138 [Firmicutes bacterium ADurb.Bin354]|jgi:methyl-accepting chemotaxis protein|nr:MAG: hypothetical protein BWY61_00138 [Firmicutes bacterium ADurb.Bin354]SCX77868.1 hypothetical protein SAMN02910370_00077 [Lachnospiraceae bacterium XPB1003]
MDKKTGTGIILVIILVGVITAIAINVWSAKQEVERYQEMQQTISANAENVEEMGDAMQDIKKQTEEGYENLDQQIDN